MGTERGRPEGGMAPPLVDLVYHRTLSIEERDTVIRFFSRGLIAEIANHIDVVRLWS